MIYGSVCSGIEAASVAWHPLGWRAAFFSEIEAFPRAVLAERFPGVPLHGDFTTINPGDYEPIDLLVGGTPCQDFSVAGLRAGLAGDRGALTIEFVRLAGRIRPRWLVWENVPGVLSADRGHAFGLFLGLLAECGYGFAYRVLDAQHFGVPQRRRRVFVVGYLGDWRPAAAVLFEPESLRGDSPPRRGERQRVARPIAGCPEGGSGWRADADTADNLIAADCAPPITRNPYGDHESREGLLVSGTLRGHPRPGSNSVGAIAFGGNNTAGPVDVATACNAHGGPHGRLDFESETFVTHSLRADGFDASEDGTGRGTPLIVGTVTSNGDAHSGFKDEMGLVPVAFQSSQSGVRQVEAHATLDGNNGSRRHNGVQSGMSVRRLTPRECERLQGFPDDYTNIIGYDSRRTGKFGGNRGVADGPRYRALGNSMAVPCMAWLGRRIEFIKAVMECMP